MRLIHTPLQGLYEVQADTKIDARGKFTRLFCEQEFSTILPNMHFRQINLSETTRKGSIRGLHFQTPPAAEAKLIRCLRGRIFDVAVDLRLDSPTFLQWHGLELSDDNGHAVFIPEGFAHGFQSLTDDVQLLYMHTTFWSQAHEAGLRHNDPRIDICWPLNVSMISEKDAALPLIGDAFPGMRL